MNYDEFVGRVQHRARLGTTGETIRAIHATFKALGKRLHGGEADHLAAQLPPELGAYLTDAGESETYDLDGFFARVSQYEGLGEDLPDSVHHARAVISVLQEAISAGEMNHVREQLPEDYAPLFEAGASGELDRN
ncbi:MAG: DUF2267 domain-containing protein [Anaerolineales bacterium]